MSRRPAGSLAESAFRAKAPENEFAFAKHPLAQRTRGWPGHIIPFQVFDIATAVADEVVMPRAFCIKSRRAALHCHFTHQTSLNQVAQIVINRSPGGTWIEAVNTCKNLRRRGMPGLLHQERHDSVALRSAPQTAARKGASNRLGIHQE